MTSATAGCCCEGGHRYWSCVRLQTSIPRCQAHVDIRRLPCPTAALEVRLNSSSLGVQISAPMLHHDLAFIEQVAPSIGCFGLASCNGFACSRCGQDHKFERFGRYPVQRAQPMDKATGVLIGQGGVVFDLLDPRFAGQKMVKMALPACRILPAAVAANGGLVRYRQWHKRRECSATERGAWHFSNCCGGLLCTSWRIHQKTTDGPARSSWQQSSVAFRPKDRCRRAAFFYN